MEEVIKSYIAGIIDGEGTITLSRSSKTSKFRHPIISVSNTDMNILNLLKNSVGGSISKHKTYKKHHKQSWSWKISYNKALLLLENIRPYLRCNEKIYRMNILLNEYKSVTNRNGKYTNQQKKKKLDFENRFFQ
jgi:hypothetical protein